MEIILIAVLCSLVGVLASFFIMTKLKADKNNGKKKSASKKKTVNVKRQPMEFSKKILVVSWIAGMAIILYALWLSYMIIIQGYHGDVSIILTILGGAFTEITAGTSFYYWKAKKENEIKLTGIYNVEGE